MNKIIIITILLVSSFTNSSFKEKPVGCLKMDILLVGDLSGSFEGYEIFVANAFKSFVFKTEEIFSFDAELDREIRFIITNGPKFEVSLKNASNLASSSFSCTAASLCICRSAFDQQERHLPACHRQAQ